MLVSAVEADFVAEETSADAEADRCEAVISLFAASRGRDIPDGPADDPRSVEDNQTRSTAIPVLVVEGHQMRLMNPVNRYLGELGDIEADIRPFRIELLALEQQD